MPPLKTLAVYNIECAVVDVESKAINNTRLARVKSV